VASVAGLLSTMMGASEVDREHVTNRVKKTGIC